MSQQLRKRKGLKRKRPGANGAYKQALLKMQRKETVQLLLVIFGLPALLYFLSSKYSEYKAREILKEPAFAVGVLTQVGRNVTVEFKVASNTYSFKRRESEGLMQGRVAGDTVVVIYSRTDPENAALKRGFTMLLDN